MKDQAKKQAKLLRNKKKRKQKKAKEFAIWECAYVKERQQDKIKKQKFYKNNYMSKDMAENYTKSVMSKELVMNGDTDNE